MLCTNKKCVACSARIQIDIEKMLLPLEDLSREERYSSLNYTWLDIWYVVPSAYLHKRGVHIDAFWVVQLHVFEKQPGEIIKKV